MTRPYTSPRKWAKKVEAARLAAEDERFKIGHAVALLEMLGEHIGRPGVCPDDLECQELGLRVEYLAQQIGRHAEDLHKELRKIEAAAMALGRGGQAEPDPTLETESGNVVRLSRPDGDAA